jgi:hypothetical protein
MLNIMDDSICSTSNGFRQIVCLVVHDVLLVQSDNAFRGQLAYTIVTKPQRQAQLNHAVFGQIGSEHLTFYR